MDPSRLRRAATAVLTVLAICLVLGGLDASAAPAPPGVVDAPGPGAATPYQLPVSGSPSVLRGFEPPPTPYAAGHRGVDLATAPGATVFAAGDGTVTFAGQVAGRGIVVIRHSDAVSTEYEPVTASVRRGQSVRRGEPIGIVAGAHGDCPIDGCLHWGAQLADVYLDPLTLLHPLGAVHLVAVDG